ncbi:hypothetical protein [Chishuiella sp.]|uniref:hypothetical protein n=1 Tax=Chishuiella sp. TaxID=1969467 RepID=UPI0028B1C9ED|nr:hypothetical protein [Chishuiella sp.]
MNNNLAKHIIGIFFTLILVFSTNMQGFAGYVDQQIKLEQKEVKKSQKKINKLFSQSSSEEDNNQSNSSSKEITEKIQYFHEIKLFTFANLNTTENYNYYHSKHYNFMNDGVTTPPPEVI